MKRKKLDLALQGGGSHGAYTWGILERLLEDRRIIIDGICGTSAGAMNAVITAAGLQKGGREGAIAHLNEFWRRIAHLQSFGMIKPSDFDKLFGSGMLKLTPVYNMMEMFMARYSPYEFNPLNINPLRYILADMVDFEKLRATRYNKLFICATNVRTSQAKVFDNETMNLDAVLASACLPFLFQAVEIDGEAYWDGGYMGNPPLYPLIDNTRTSDIMIVQINPIRIPNIPKTVEEIRDRINEIAFNSSLIHDIRQINLVRKMLDRGINIDGKFRDLYIHNIAPERLMAKLSSKTKMNADIKFLLKLKKYGKSAADRWLKENFDKIGNESTCDIEEVFLSKSKMPIRQHTVAVDLDDTIS